MNGSGGNESELKTIIMRKRKRIRKQLKKFYFKNRKSFRRTERLMFRLLIAMLGIKRGSLPLLLRVVKWLSNLLFIDSRPGSFIRRNIYVRCY